MEHHLYVVHYFINIGYKDTYIINVQQQGEKLLVPQTHLYQVARLDPEFDKPRDILVNSYNPDDQAQNAIL